MITKRRAPILLALLLVTLGGDALAAREIEHALAFGGISRSYVVHAPPTLGARPAAVVIALHGFGGSGRNILDQGGWRAKADAAGFIVVAPDGIPERDDRPARFFGNPRSWNSGPETGSPAERRGIDDVGFIAAVIDDVARRYRIDPKRIYATGFSNGAAMAFRLGAELSDRIAAIAPVANGLLVPVPRLKKPVSLLMIWGTEDPLNPYQGGVLNRQAGRVVRPSAEASLQRWSAALACPRQSRVEVRRDIETRTLAPCTGNSEARLIAVKGLGHQWPGGRVALRMVSGPGSNAINATDAIWSFFEAHPQR